MKDTKAVHQNVNSVDGFRGKCKDFLEKNVENPSVQMEVP